MGIPLFVDRTKPIRVVFSGIYKIGKANLDPHTPEPGSVGGAVAYNLLRFPTVTQPERGNDRPGSPYCSERHRLTDALLAAVRELAELQSQQTRAIIANDPDFSRFDDLIHVAQTAKNAAKYALLAHIDEHRCD